MGIFLVTVLGVRLGNAILMRTRSSESCGWSSSVFCSVASGMSFPALLAWIQVARAAVTTGKVEVEALVLQLPFLAQNQSLSLLLTIFYKVVMRL